VTRFRICCIIGVAAVMAAAGLFVVKRAPRFRFAYQFGKCVPSSTQNLRIEIDGHRDYRSKRVWAVMDVPLLEAKRLADDLHLVKQTERFGIDTDPPARIGRWWTPDISEDSREVWYATSRELGLGKTYCVWRSGHFFLFRSGRPLGNWATCWRCGASTPSADR
jgi:hypothetical protein